MGKRINCQSGYALLVVLVFILVMGLLTPVMLTAATYGMKNTKSTNDNFSARYIADSAYQETLNKVKRVKASHSLSNENDIHHFINNEIITQNGSLHAGTYTTNYHPDYPTSSHRPKMENVGGGPNQTKYTYYLRSIGNVNNQTAIVDYSISFILKKVGSTTILYETANKKTTYDRLPTTPDNLKEIARGETALNHKVNNEFNNKLNGTSLPYIAFKYNLTPVPALYKNEINSSEIINKNARVSKIDLINNASLTVNGDLYVDNDLHLNNNTALIVKGNLYIGTNFSVDNNAMIKVAGDLIAKNSIHFNNNIHFEINGNMFVQGGLKIENNASNSKIGGSLYVFNNIDIENNGQVLVSKDIVANNINLINNTLLKTGGEVLVKNEFKAKNNAIIELSGGLEVGTQLILSNNVAFKFAQKLYITNLLELGNNGQMLLIKSSGSGSGISYIVDIEDPKKLET
ncbi:hypothetical protein [Neobacillus thermocopriae]|uniref:Type 4 fimbrial biogenesis protein PilX N-terminal domain-containing protein n=1 Tax=Neobacillus thermocopriae TaxID=1215031 RepID=A0A6B3TPV0_9BACI|nr:hypothetical protein [Neobacillus thermocopriae]NEX78350.1 hypothetical protein [Neobacillus thermocopriae]